ncbi:hypothetical protein DSO57_1009226 [Entomophthora muscae]|uniref:Uncharacterized protein n=1 Tax=Entomophthora muscae TaxID=34485 RepID=A0ACC2TIS3_9FUNG|nr:hypothetical protein DSO57_1009226 [Entomophthora muscae]
MKPTSYEPPKSSNAYEKQASPYVPSKSSHSPGKRPYESSSYGRKSTSPKSYSYGTKDQSKYANTLFLTNHLLRYKDHRPTHGNPH